MPELTPADVQTYTKDRLLASDPETARLLASALRSARNYCGWHVTPIRENDVQEYDGPGGRVLKLRTRRLIELTAVNEDGRVINPATELRVSRTMGTVKKRSYGAWSGEYGSIIVTMTHGHALAEDFDDAVLSAIDAVALTRGLSSDERGGGRPLLRKRIDDVEYYWSDSDIDEAMQTSRLDAYRILVFT